MRRTRKRRLKPERLTVPYFRCSTIEQAQHGSSIETQRARCEGYAAATERAIAREFIDDGYSGSSLDRPAMQALLEAIAKGEIGCVIAAKLDRYSRNLADTLGLIALAEKHGVELCSAAESLDTSSASGRMFVNVSGSFAQFERDRIAERTSEALAVKRNAHTVYVIMYSAAIGRRALNSILESSSVSEARCKNRCTLLGRPAARRSTRCLRASLTSASEAFERS